MSDVKNAFEIRAADLDDCAISELVARDVNA